MLSLICQEIMSGFKTFKLALQGLCSTGVRFYCKPVVRSSDCFSESVSYFNRPLSVFLRIKIGCTVFSLEDLKIAGFFCGGEGLGTELTSGSAGL